MWAWVALLAGFLSACAGKSRPTQVPVFSVPPSVAGFWFWSQRSVGSQGDLQVEEERWQLRVLAQAIAGHYDRTVTFISADGRPFRCNGEMSFTRRTRYQLSGRLTSKGVEIAETDYDVDPGPCESGLRMLDRYNGVVGREKLVLAWEGGEQVLMRGRGESVEGKGSNGSSRGEIAGNWVWEQRSVDANGNRRIESEVWYIERDGDDLRGSYDSTLTFTSGDDRAFACNAAREYSTRARFEFSGHLDGKSALIKETNYTVEPNLCDPGLRRLGSYKGVFDGETLVLDWGRGRQALRRGTGSSPASNR